MTFEVRTVGEVSIIDLKSRITHGSGDVEMKETAQRLLDAGKKKIVMNLDKVTFMDSAGIGELVACHKRAVEKGAVIKVLRPNEKLLDLFAITKLIEIFEIFTDEKEAVASF
jgi:anti-sigma B factor antagonist